ncbi:MAG TPA: hypothetical protein VFU31_00535 [Candidatus Binatia bacterium]|nr:hypothetical protein [Candidatus Binatia bacterium]
MKQFCILAYVPPPNVQGAEQFLANVRRYKTKYPLVLFSDHHKYGDDVKPLKKSPEIAKGAKYPNGLDNKWALNNLVFLTGLRVLGDSCTHFLYLEADCRVNGDFWDGIVFDEFQLRNPDAIASGTLATYNVHNRNMAFSRCWQTFIAENGKSQFPITGYGGNGAAETQEPAVFPNGALAIYELAWLRKTFGTENMVAKAAEITAFDYAIGRQLVRDYGNDVFRKVLHLNSVYSSYGDVQTSEGERQDLLTSKAVVAVHQIKSVWAGPAIEGDIDTGTVREVPDIDGGQPAFVTLPPPDPAAVQVIENVEKLAYAAPPLPRDPKVEIFIVSYAPDIPYLRHNLKSIEKFCTGFSGVTVLVPKHDELEFLNLAQDFGNKLIELKTYVVPKSKKLWHIAHQLQKCYADKWCPGAEYVLHTDSDCIFTRPTTPADFFAVGWKPILCIEPFSRIGSNPWKSVIDAALKIDSRYETMRRHGAIHPLDIYSRFRDFMTRIHSQKIDKWWMEQKADYPWGVTEFNFLGNYVKHILSDERYAFIDISKDYTPPSPIFQFWSHSTPFVEQDFPSGGRGVPMEKLKELGLVQ